MANITIQNLEVESTALNQVSPGEMEKVIGGQVGIAAGSNFNCRNVAPVAVPFGSLLSPFSQVTGRGVICIPIRLTGIL
jgi:hypothetical protein